MKSEENIFFSSDLKEKYKSLRKNTKIREPRFNVNNISLIFS